jgi:hypothetical protein
VFLCSSIPLQVIISTAQFWLSLKRFRLSATRLKLRSAARPTVKQDRSSDDCRSDEPSPCRTGKTEHGGKSKQYFDYVDV